MWVQHPVYSNYIVSDLGEVRHVNSSNNRSCRTDKYGYLRFNIVFHGKRITLKLHTMVADCFVENKLNLPTVNHIDGNKRNNNATNLEWMSAGDNTSDSFTRAHKGCCPVVVGGIEYRSKRQAERKTGISRFKLTGEAL